MAVPGTALSVAVLTGRYLGSVDELPLIDATTLTAAQRAGRACAVCGKRFPRPDVPAGRTGAGEILRRFPDCPVILKPAD